MCSYCSTDFIRQQNLFWTETEGVVFKKIVATQKQQRSFVSFDLFESRKVKGGRGKQREVRR
jgi:hypothetical protein